MSVITDGDDRQPRRPRTTATCCARVPGLNVIQMSARDINITSRQGTSHPVQLAARAAGRPLDLPRLLRPRSSGTSCPSNPDEIKQIEVVRGPASAVWGANALTGVVNIITKTPRESRRATTLTLTGGIFDRDAGSTRRARTRARATAAQRQLRGRAQRHLVLPARRRLLQLRRRSPRSVPGTGSRVRSATRWTRRFRPAARPTRRTARPCARGAGLREPGHQPAEGRPAARPGARQRRAHHLQRRLRRHRRASSTPASGPSTSRAAPTWPTAGSAYAQGRLQGRRPSCNLARRATRRTCSAVDPHRAARCSLTFKTKTYDLEVGNSTVLGRQPHPDLRRQRAAQQLRHHASRPTRRTAPSSGAYFQDEIFFDKFRFAVGGRVDKFGNIDDPVFSPRVVRDVQAGAGPRLPRLLQPRVPLAVRHQQLPRRGHDHRACFPLRPVDPPAGPGGRPGRRPGPSRSHVPQRRRADVGNPA